MQWRDINYTHHDKKVCVRHPDSTQPEDEAYTGRVVCMGTGVLPILAVGKVMHAFVGWYEVTMVDANE